MEANGSQAQAPCQGVDSNETLASPLGMTQSLGQSHAMRTLGDLGQGIAGCNSALGREQRDGVCECSTWLERINIDVFVHVFAGVCSTSTPLTCI